MTCYIPRWFTHPQTVTCPSTNRAQCQLTMWIEANALTTTLCRHLSVTYMEMTYTEVIQYRGDVVVECSDQLKKRLLFHTSYKLYLASLSFAVLHLFIMSIAYGKYANDGIRDEGFRTFGNC